MGFEVDGTYDVGYDRKKQFTLGTLNDVNVIGAGLKDFDQLAQMFAFLCVDRQANQLVVIVHARRERRGRADSASIWTS